MLSLIDKGLPTPCPAPFNMAGYVLQKGLETPDKIALSVVGLSGAERWSYSKLRQAVLGMATGLLDHGLQPGDRILMRVNSSVDFPILYLAAIAVDLIPVPTSTQLTGPEVDIIADIVAPALVVFSEGVALPDRVNIPALTINESRQFQELPAAKIALGDPDRPAYIVFTSGTSGTPRAVTHAHRAIWARRMMFDGWYGLRESDRVLHAGAFNWTYTLGTGLMDPWTMGATALIPGSDITPTQLPLMLKRHDATIFAAAPGVFRQMLKTDIPAMPKLRHGLSAGEKLPEVTRNTWQKLTGTQIHEAYGMSECSTFVSGCPDWPAPAGTLGYPQAGRKLAVMGPDGPVPIGQDGRLAISASDQGLMVGYWNKGKNGPEPIDTEWFLTGDTVSLRSDGAVEFHGRDDDILNAGGYRVSPIEVEAALNMHDDIQECAAIEVRVRDDTSLIALYYVADSELSGLDHFAAQSLARYKQPRIYERIGALPKSANGKIQRKQLRAKYKADHGET